MTHRAIAVHWYVGNVDLCVDHIALGIELVLAGHKDHGHRAATGWGVVRWGAGISVVHQAIDNVNIATIAFIACEAAARGNGRTMGELLWHGRV